MRPAYLFLLLFCIIASSSASGAEQTVLIEKIDIKGNRVTRDAYIRSFLTFEEEKRYQLDALLNEINRSRENLTRTGLFEDIFFDDEVMEENAAPDDMMIINLLIRVKEKNYFVFGPAGYLGLEDHNFYAKTAVYAGYTNLCGNASQIHFEVPLYMDTGISLLQTGPVGRLQYRLGYIFADDKFLMSKSHTVTAGLGYDKGGSLKPGASLQLQNADLVTFAFFPYIEAGASKRPADRRRRWYTARISPFFGLNSDNSSFYGLINTAGLYHDIFLKIVYAATFEVSAGSGDFPDQYLFYADVRGTQFQRYSSTYRLSMSNEFHIPWPLNNRITFVPFLEINYLARTFLAGGGIGLHLFTRYQDPLVFDVAFGRGIMLYFNVRH